MAGVIKYLGIKVLIILVNSILVKDMVKVQWYVSLYIISSVLTAKFKKVCGIIMNFWEIQRIPNHDQMLPNHNQMIPSHDKMILGHNQMILSHNQMILSDHIFQNHKNHEKMIPIHDLDM